MEMKCRQAGGIATSHLRNWVDGNFFGAVQCWEQVLVRYPFDLLALQLVHLTDVLLGDVVGQRDSVARVYAMWDESVTGYEYLLGFYAFGLEENTGWFRLSVGAVSFEEIEQALPRVRRMLDKLD